jgi:hypothetical protein
MRRMRAWAIRVAVAACCVVSSTRPVLADEEPEALIRQGNEMRRGGDNARAFGYFKRAYDIGHTPRSAAQLGLVEQALGHFVDSERHLSEALGAADPWVDANRTALDNSREKARAHLGKLDLRGARAGTTIEVDGGPAMAVPSDGIVWAKPGETTVRVAPPGRAMIVKQISVSAGASVVIAIEEEGPSVAKSTSSTEPMASAVTSSDGTRPAAAATTPGPPGASETAPPVSLATSGSLPPRASAGAGKRLAGLVGAGAGVALGVAGLFVYRAGAAKFDAINQAKSNGTAYDPSDGNFETLANSGIAMMVAGGGAIVGGGLVYLWGRNEQEAATDTHPTHAGIGYVPGRGVTLNLSGSF